MKVLFVLFFCLITGLTGYCQNDSIRGNQFHLIGKINTDVEMTPLCGYIAWATVIKFEVINLTGITYLIKNIGIIVPCPEAYAGDFLKKGRKYQVIFSDKNQADFGWVIMNKDRLKNNTISFDPYLISIKRIQ